MSRNSLVVLLAPLVASVALPGCAGGTRREHPAPRPALPAAVAPAPPSVSELPAKETPVVAPAESPAPTERADSSRTPLRRVLPNGLTVVLEESHQAKVVAFQVWVKVGSADETDDEAGLAHVHEHMLFKGTARRGVGEIAQAVEAAGGDINAWTSFDQTVYHVVLASRFFDQGLDVLADAVQHSSFDPAELDRELEVVIEEVKRSRDMPGRVISELTFDTAYQAHTYRRPVIGYEATVRAFTREKILAFYKKHYRPDRMVLVVTGDFQADEALKKIEETFKDFTSAPGAPALSRPQEPTQTAVRVRVARDKIQETHLSLAWHIPSMMHEDIYALDVLSILLGHGDSSRLSRGVKHGRRLVNDVYAYAYTPRDPGLLMAGASLHHKDLGPALQAILVETYRLRDALCTTAELEKAKTLIESDAVYQKETVQGLARKLGFYEAVAGHVDFEKRYLDGIRRVTAADVRRVARRYLTEEGLTAIALLPDTAPALGEADLMASITAASAELAVMRQQNPLSKGDLGVYRAVLHNGVTLLVLPDPSVPVVSMRAVWLGGLRWETAADNGIHNIMAELLTKGIEGGPGAMELAHEVDSAAGTLEGFTGRNSFGIRAEFLTRTFERGFELMADCIIRPAFNPDEIERERKLVLEEIRNKEDNLSGVAFDLFGKLLYQAHPYRMDALGTKATVEKLSRDDILKVFRERFTPDRMVLSVVGDVDPERVAELVEDAFNDVPRSPGGGPKSPVFQPEAPPQTTRVGRQDRDKEQAHLVLGFPGTTLSHPDRYALEVLTTILAGQGGRLFIELRDRQSLAYSITAFSLEGLDPGYVAVYMGTSPDKVDTALKGIQAELEKIRAEPVSDKELERAKRYLVGTHEIGLQKMSARAATLAFNEVYGLGYADHAQYSDRVMAITADDLLAVARKYLTLERSTLAVVGPEGAGPKATVKP